jgi:hypothetical protein
LQTSYPDVLKVAFIRPLYKGGQQKQYEIDLISNSPAASAKKCKTRRTRGERERHQNKLPGLEIETNLTETHVTMHFAFRGNLLAWTRSDILIALALRPKKKCALHYLQYYFVPQVDCFKFNRNMSP